MRRKGKYKVIKEKGESEKGEGDERKGVSDGFYCEAVSQTF